MNRAGRYSTNTPVGIVIIGLSLGSFRQNARLGSFGQNSYWVRSAKTPLGLFRQNARWVRLAKTPAGASLDGQCDLQKVQEVQKDAWPTRRRQARRGFLQFLHFLQHKGGTLQSRQQSDALRASYARCERFSS